MSTKLSAIFGWSPPRRSPVVQILIYSTHTKVTNKNYEGRPQSQPHPVKSRVGGAGYVMPGVLHSQPCSSLGGATPAHHWAGLAIKLIVTLAWVAPPVIPWVVTVQKLSQPHCCLTSGRMGIGPHRQTTNLWTGESGCLSP